MNIKFVEDLKNSLMRVTIKLKKRKLAREERVMLGWYKLKEIVDEQYKCSSTHVLGECTNPHQKMDNDYDHLLEKTWVFNLIPKQPPKKKFTKSKRTKKATVKK
jgi:hypothetical protein